ncbi:DUF4296 domain-containing protein [Aquimarina sp. TRL1]|uniref:DUF4296 domain-containing protein n=1 Tax=Aquimarina sp. (strain TRL1) TaxID=2736252 RepID=UPI00158EF6AE|nr:DUF4296 domain-containing protein [Aquimarina sp. TRL1]QKX04424.1 DUF4296 domain-containing protein [Aquimarina sp. TRL1]
MNKKLCLVIMTIVVFSCQSIDKKEKPDPFIQEERMVEILTDIAYVKAAKISYKKKLEEKYFDPEAYILKKHGIDSLVFEKNRAWYITKLDRYKKVFDSVKKQLEKRKVAYEELEKKEDSLKRKEDSLRMFIHNKNKEKREIKQLKKERKKK